jgi:hypothetical protein
MIKVDRNMWDLWQIVCKKYINISAFVGFIVLIISVDPASSGIVHLQEV